jgi:hypothetical protein
MDANVIGASVLIWWLVIGLVMECALGKGASQPLSIAAEFHHMPLIEDIRIRNFTPHIRIPRPKRCHARIIQLVAAINRHWIGHPRVHDPEKRRGNSDSLGQFQQISFVGYPVWRKPQAGERCDVFCRSSTGVDVSNGSMNEVADFWVVQSKEPNSNPGSLIQLGGNREIVSGSDEFSHLLGLAASSLSDYFRSIRLASRCRCKTLSIDGTVLQFEPLEPTNSRQNDCKGSNPTCGGRRPPGRFVLSCLTLLFGFALLMLAFYIADEPEPPITTRLVYWVVGTIAAGFIIQGVFLASLLL